MPTRFSYRFQRASAFARKVDLTYIFQPIVDLCSSFLKTHRILLYFICFALSGILIFSIRSIPATADEMAMQRCIWGCLAGKSNNDPAYHACVAKRCEKKKASRKPVNESSRPLTIGKLSESVQPVTQTSPAASRVMSVGTSSSS